MRSYPDTDIDPSFFQEFFPPSLIKRSYRNIREPGTVGTQNRLNNTRPWFVSVSTNFVLPNFLIKGFLFLQ